MDCDKTEESSAQIFILYENIYPSFLKKQNGWWGQPFLPEIFGQTEPVGAKTPSFN